MTSAVDLATPEGCKWVDMLMHRLSALEVKTDRLEEENDRLRAQLEDMYVQPQTGLLFRGTVVRPEGASLPDVCEGLADWYFVEGMCLTVAFPEKGCEPWSCIAGHPRSDPTRPSVAHAGETHCWVLFAWS